MPIRGADRMPGTGLALGTLFNKELNATSIEVADITLTSSLILEKSTSENRYTITWTQPTSTDRALTIPALGADDQFTFNDATQTLTAKTLTSPTITGGALTGLTDLDMTSGDKTILDTIGANSLTIGAGDTTVIMAGNLTVSGTTTTVNTTTLTIEDSLYIVNHGTSGTPSEDAGLVVERGSSTNTAMIWDESADEFSFINTSEDGTTAGDVTIASYADIQANGITGTSLLLDGDKSVNPADGGVVHIDLHTITDSSTSGSGTAARYSHVNIESPALAATNSSVTTSDASTLRINGPVTAGSNQTLTRAWSLWVDSGNARFDGSIYSGTTEAISSAGLVTVANQSNITGVGTITSGVWTGTAIAGAYINDDIISGQTEITTGLVAADELLYSDGGTVKKVGLDNFMEIAPTLVTEDAVADGDYILFLDGGATGNMNKEAVHDLATLFAGTGLTASSSVIGVDASQTQITAVGTIATGVWEGTTVAVDQGGTGATSLNNLITLATHTTGDYVQNITAGTGLTSTGATSGENIAHSLSVDAAQTGITSLGTQAADFKIGNGYGFLLGHTTQEAIEAVSGLEWQMHGTANADSRMAIGRWSADNNGPRIHLFKSGKSGAGGTIGTNAIVADDAHLGSIVWGADDGTDLDSAGARISAYIDGTPGEDDTPGRLVFSTTADGAKQVTDRMIITSTGVVAVGGSTVGAASGGINLQVDNNFGIFLQESASQNNYFGVKVNDAEDMTQLISGSGASVNTGFVFHTAASGSEAEAMRITSGGNVLIGGDEAGANEYELQIARNDTYVQTAYTVYSDNINHSPQLYFRKSNSDTFGTLTATVDTHVLGRINFAGVGYYSSATTFTDGAYIEAVQTGAVEDTVTSKLPTALTFGTATASDDVAAERMRINDTGGIQIGASGAITQRVIGGGAQVNGRGLQVDGSDEYTGISITSWSADEKPPYLQLSTSQNNTAGTMTATADGAVLGYIRFEGVDTTPRFDVGASIHSVQVGSAGSRVPADLRFGTSTSSSPSEKMRIDTEGQIYIGDTANTGDGSTGVGVDGGSLTINMGANGSEILSLKSSEIAHGMTGNYHAETDTFGNITKVNDANGGMNIKGFSETTRGLALSGYHVTDSTDHTVDANGCVLIRGFLKSSTTSTNPASGANILVLRGSSVDAGKVTHIFDSSGNTWFDGADQTAFDEHDDAQLVRAFDMAINKGVVQNKWDGFVEYNEQKLVDLNILGDTIDKGGLVNSSALLKLHNGAIWQSYVQQQEIKEKIDNLEKDLLQQIVSKLEDLETENKKLKQKLEALEV